MNKINQKRRSRKSRRSTWIEENQPKENQENQPEENQESQLEENQPEEGQESQESQEGRKSTRKRLNWRKIN